MSHRSICKSEFGCPDAEWPSRKNERRMDSVKRLHPPFCGLPACSQRQLLNRRSDRNVRYRVQICSQERVRAGVINIITLIPTYGPSQMVLT